MLVIYLRINELDGGLCDHAREFGRGAMNKSTNLAERVRFGTFELNVRTGELVSIGTAAVEARSAKVQLRQQPFQVLRILVERQGNIVTRDEIQQIVCPSGTVVAFDRNITLPIPFPP